MSWSNRLIPFSIYLSLPSIEYFISLISSSGNVLPKNLTLLCPLWYDSCNPIAIFYIDSFSVMFETRASLFTISKWSRSPLVTTSHLVFWTASALILRHANRSDTWYLSTSIYSLLSSRNESVDARSAYCFRSVWPPESWFLKSFYGFMKGSLPTANDPIAKFSSTLCFNRIYLYYASLHSLLSCDVPSLIIYDLLNTLGFIVVVLVYAVKSFVCISLNFNMELLNWIWEEISCAANILTGGILPGIFPDANSADIWSTYFANISSLTPSYLCYLSWSNAPPISCSRYSVTSGKKSSSDVFVLVLNSAHFSITVENRTFSASSSRASSDTDN